MNRKQWTISLLLAASLPASAIGPGLEKECRPYADAVAKAVVLKQQGIAPEKAIAELTAATPNPSPDKPDAFALKMQGAVRMAYMMNMAPKEASQLYFKQCMIGS